MSTSVVVPFPVRFPVTATMAAVSLSTGGRIRVKASDAGQAVKRTPRSKAAANDPQVEVRVVQETALATGETVVHGQAEGEATSAQEAATPTNEPSEWDQPFSVRTFNEAKIGMQRFYSLGPGRLGLDLFSVMYSMPEGRVQFRDLCARRGDWATPRREKIRRRMDQVILRAKRNGFVEQSEEGLQLTVKGRQFVAGAMHSRCAAAKLSSGRYSLAEVSKTIEVEELTGMCLHEEEPRPLRREMVGIQLAACMAYWNRAPAAKGVQC